MTDDFYDKLVELKNVMSDFLSWAEEIQAGCDRDCPDDPEAAKRLCDRRMKEHPDFARYLPLMKKVLGDAHEAAGWFKYN
jgi:hypothetical protein